MKLYINRILRTLALCAALAMIAPSLSSCNKELGIKVNLIEFDEDYLVFERPGGSQSVGITSSVSRLDVSVLNGTWCTAAIENGKLVVSAKANVTSKERMAVVKVEGGGVEQTLSVSQKPRALTFVPQDLQFDYASVFTDDLCSQLKPGIGQTQIDNIGSTFFRELAQEIFEANYDTEFRIRECHVHQDPKIMKEYNKASFSYGQRDNPTGIYVTKGETLVFFAKGVPGGVAVRLIVQDPDRRTQGYTSYVHNGLNYFTPTHSGLVYVIYQSDAASEPPLEIHFATGSVNGYFDIAKHQPGEWTQRLSNAGFRHFDLVGEKVIMTFETQMFRHYTPDGTELVKAFDNIVRMVHDFSGLVKYDREFKTRLYCLVMDHEDYMHATEYYTGYSLPTQPSVLDVSQLTTSQIWSPAHEVGHMNQIKPAMKWYGMVEVTNNIFALHVQTSLGNTSRLMTGSPNRYQTARTEIIDGEIPHNAGSIFSKVVPFWQLKLYLMDAQGKTDFYKDLFEHMRQGANPTQNGDAQMNFVKLACQVSGLDLRDFFEKWGFLTPINLLVGDNELSNQFIVTQTMIDRLKNEISAMELPKPAHDNIYEITDENVSSFR